LSASASPAPFCGIPEAAGADVDSEGDVGAGVGVEDEDVVGVADLDELEEPELPQPAATSATSTTLSAANRRIALFVVFPNIVIAINGSSRWVAVLVATVVPRVARRGVVRPAT
jgi:hypothetical protein